MMSYFVTPAPPPAAIAEAEAEDSMIYIKPGCRGDPRMNRAVQAKLEDPRLSLFDALRLGGFHYQRNVDAATMDNDRVTLGQRKNQLNRRLRLARKNLNGKDEEGAPSGKDMTDKKKKTSETVSTVPSGISSALVIAGSYLRQKSRKSVPTKRCAPTTPTEKPQGKKQCTVKAKEDNNLLKQPHVPPPDNNSEVCLNNALFQSAWTNITQNNRLMGTVSPTEEENSLKAFLANPSLIPDTVQPDWQSQRCFVEDKAGTSTGILQQSNQPEVMEELDLISPDMMDFIHAESNFIPQSQAQPSQPHQQAQSSQVPQSSLPYPRNTSQESATIFSGDLISFTSCEDSKNNIGSIPEWLLLQVPGQQLQPEQVLATQSLPPTKEELGLCFFQTGLQKLYQKSMSVAGFQPDDTKESSQTFQSFAFEAWRREAERLQVLLNVADGDGYIQRNSAQQMR